MIRRWHGGFVHRIRRVRKVAWSPIRRAARDTARASAARLGSTLLPPWRCPGCGAWRQRRRLARCAGVVAASPLRQQIFASGCPRCGLIYAAPRPAARQLESLYAETGEWAASHPGDREVPRIGRQLLAAVDERTGIRTPVERSQVLDFGCGHGRWLNRLAACGWDTFGIDPSTKTAFTRHTELAAVSGSPRFQLVIASHVLEHVPYPGEVLNALGRATLPGGWIFVSVPNLDRLPDHREWRAECARAPGGVFVRLPAGAAGSCRLRRCHCRHPSAGNEKRMEAFARRRTAGGTCSAAGASAGRGSRCDATRKHHRGLTPAPLRQPRALRHSAP